VAIPGIRPAVTLVNNCISIAPSGWNEGHESVNQTHPPVALGLPATDR
jgi:hypothetical protein